MGLRPVTKVSVLERADCTYIIAQKPVILFTLHLLRTYMCLTIVSEQLSQSYWEGMYYHRRPKHTLRVCYVNQLSHKRVGVALQAIVETLYQK